MPPDSSRRSSSGSKVGSSRATWGSDAGARGHDGLMRVAILGASGMIGTALCGSLTSKGHRVVRLVRRPPQSADEVYWNPATAHVELPTLDGVEAVVNLAGGGVPGPPGAPAYKQDPSHHR